MLKVLSTKLNVEEIDRFTAMAEQQGESKSGLLRRLVQDYLNSTDKADRGDYTDTPYLAKSPRKGLPPERFHSHDGLHLGQSPSSFKPLSSQGAPSKSLVSINRQQQTGSPVPTSTGNVGVQKVEIVEQNSDSPSSSRDSLPVYQTRSKGSPEASPKSVKGELCLLLIFLVALWLNSKPSVTVDRRSVFTPETPQVDENGLYTFRVGNTIVYGSSPIPFW